MLFFNGTQKIVEPFKIAIFLKYDFQKSDDYSNIHAMQQIIYELRNSIIILCPSLASRIDKRLGLKSKVKYQAN